MAAAALPSVYYKFPGGADLEKPDFYSMCEWYVNSYFSDFVNDSGSKNVHLVPPLPLKNPPEPPESSSGGAFSSLSTKGKKITKEQYDNFRTVQKSSIDEYNLVKTIQKHATESQTPMFIFHGFKIDRKKWKLIQSIADSELRSEDSLRELEKLLKEENWLDDMGDPKEIEIDVVTVDPTNGVIIWEVKSRNSEVQPSTSVHNKKLIAAGKQLRRDVAIISWLSKSFTSKNISTSIKKVVVLPDDQITAEDDAKFREKRNYVILDCVLLSEYGNFSHWFQTEITGNDKPDLALKHSIYRELVPLMVGLAATVVTLTSDKSLQASEDKEGVSYPDAIAKLDSEIDQQKLTRQNKQFTDVLSTKKQTKLRSLKGLEIMFLTPQQQSVLECSSNGLKIVKGPAGSGKTILTILKILKLCAREPKKKILIFCNSKYGRKYLDILTKNGVEAKIHGYTQAIKLDFLELDSLPGFTQPGCQVLIFNEIPNRVAFNSVIDYSMRPVRRKSTHIFIDDCELPNLGFHIPEIIRKAADDKQCLTWVALDHHQCFYSGGFDEKDDWYKLLNKSIEFNETKIFKLEEVLRSSVEIQQFNACLACKIASCDLPVTSKKYARILRSEQFYRFLIREGKHLHKSCTAHRGIDSFKFSGHRSYSVDAISPSINEHRSRSGKTPSRMRLENYFQSFIKSKQGSNFHETKIFKLEEVLRSSVEIQQFNACLACKIASCDLPVTSKKYARILRSEQFYRFLIRERKHRHKSCTAHRGIDSFKFSGHLSYSVDAISPSINEHRSRSGKTPSRMRLENYFQSFIKSKQGSNFHGPPIQVHEFYERDIMDYGSKKFRPNETREFRLKRYYGQFAAFIFGTLIQSGASIDKVPIVSTNYFSDNNAIVGALIESGHKPIYLYDKLTKFERYTSAAFVETSKSVKSFEWERVMVVADLDLCGLSAFEKNVLMRGHLVLLYLGCTRARSQLYIVGPGMFWEFILSRLGIPENSVIVKKYRLDRSESTFEEDSNLKYTEEEIREIKKLAQQIK